jgi:hypothetical protein
VRLLIDTNILLHAVNTGSPDHAAAHRFMQQQLKRHVPWCTTWPILYEFLRVSTHRRVFPKPLQPGQAVSYVNTLLAFEEVSILSATNRHPETLTSIVSDLSHPAGNLFHDIHTATLMREHGVSEIATADTDFLQFSFLKVVNPLRG